MIIGSGFSSQLVLKKKIERVRNLLFRPNFQCYHRIINLLVLIVMPKHRSAVDVINQLQKCDGWGEKHFEQRGSRANVDSKSAAHFPVLCLTFESPVHPPPINNFQIGLPLSQSSVSPSFGWPCPPLRLCKKRWVSIIYDWRWPLSKHNLWGESHITDEASFWGTLSLLVKRAGEESSAIVSSDELQGSVVLLLLLIYWYFKALSHS